MITHTESFQKHLNVISLLLMTVDEQPTTTYITTRSDYKMSSKELNDWYTLNFKSLLLYTSDKTDEVTIHSSLSPLLSTIPWKR